MPPRRSSWIAILSPRSKAALRLAAAIFVITVIAAAASARAGNYPSKTITIIAPASPGGVTDLLARMLARRFNSDWGAQALSDAQVAYAATDVLHLHALKEKLDAMLAREGRAEVAAACFRFLPDRARLDLAGWAAEDIFAHS